MEIAEFWKLLSASQLLPAAVLQQQHQLSAKSQNAGQLAQYLVSKKWITDYQAKILLAGRTGPFHFGNYTVSGRYDQGELAGKFKARQRPTQHPVILEFFPGNSPEDLIRWQRLEQIVESLATLNSAHLVNVFESVVMPDYRCVVLQRPEGVTLASLLEGNSRIQWKKACALFAQVSAGLADLHHHGFLHRHCCPESIWISKTGIGQLNINLATITRKTAVAEGIPIGDTDLASPDQEFARYYLLPESGWTLPGAGGAKAHSTDSTDSADLEQPKELRRRANQQADLFGLGASLGRMLRGKPLIDNRLSADEQMTLLQKRLGELEELEVPSTVIQIIRNAIAAESNSGFQSAKELADQLAEVAGIKIADLKSQHPPTWQAYRRSLIPLNSGRQVDSFPVLAGVEQSKNTSWAMEGEMPIDVKSSRGSFANGGRPDGGRQQPSVEILKTKRSLWPLLGSLLGFVLILAGGAYYASTFQAPIASSSSPSADSLEALPNEEQPAATPEVDPLTELANLSEVDRPTIRQNLIADDRSTLWQSPTEGAPLVLDKLPPNPRILIDLRPTALLELEEGKRLIASLGPALSSVIRAWEERSGVTLTELNRLTVSFHLTDSSDYQPFVLGQLNSSKGIDQWLADWQQPQMVQASTGERFYVAADQQWAFMILPDSPQAVGGDSAQSSDQLRPPEDFQWFAMGAPDLISQVAADSQVARITGPLRQLINQSDRQRHFHFLFLRPALFNEQGIRWMGPLMQGFNRELNVLLPDSLQAGMLSLHLDAGTYLEFQVASSVEVKSRELQELLIQRLRQQRDRTIDFLATIPSYPHWDRVRSRLNLMLMDLFRQMRWGIEHGEIVANAWLPPIAAHNLMAAAELAISFSAGAEGVAAAAAESEGGPQTIEQLLQLKRDLNIANPPDLNLLLTDLQNEIRDEYPALPFTFRIRLMGSDLQVEGITQNQRPGELRIQQQTLANILTEIMTSANPAKDITGPEDPRCKLVWVIAEDPDQSNERSILITTRQAAANKGYTLPTAFQSREKP